MHTTIKAAAAAAATLMAAQASAEITFYQREGFSGRAFTTYETIVNLDRYGLNDRASSVVVDRQRYEVCEYAGFQGRCVILRPGSYPSLAAMGLNNQVSSVRPISWSVRIEPERFAPPPVVIGGPDYYRRRSGERLYEVPVADVRAVIGPPEQRCWIEKERIVHDDDQPNVGGAVVGALIGGVLGHQIGAGSGRDLATVGGAVAGAAIGANADDGRPDYSVRRVQRCSSWRDDDRPQFWDVVYYFRGAEHHMQTSMPPRRGAMITVNDYGEPRMG
ncbi:beta/gamma crystallin-related protein [Ideonella sp.]|uniref:beta/gamma crystallin-related protein n=1 Tax=Ideonella sp. TaxID=1929293 RepID=UPI002B460E19|nr:beta/gamma crystallin-related protein [Ideonella sp.]HJV69782.1 beta/gamma crystallin-related protein [Ideonella sp.]